MKRSDQGALVVFVRVACDQAREDKAEASALCDQEGVVAPQVLLTSAEGVGVARGRDSPCRELTASREHHEFRGGTLAPSDLQVFG